MKILTAQLTMIDLETGETATLTVMQLIADPPRSLENELLHQLEAGTVSYRVSIGTHKNEIIADELDDVGAIQLAANLSRAVRRNVIIETLGADGELLAARRFQNGASAETALVSF